MPTHVVIRPTSVPYSLHAAIFPADMILVCEFIPLISEFPVLPWIFVTKESVGVLFNIILLDRHPIFY